MRLALVGLVAATTALAFAEPASAGTVENIRAKGFVQCGVSLGIIGFSSPDGNGDWEGLDVDVCRAVAAAVFGDAHRVAFTPLSTSERFAALQSGEIDILSRTTTWTLARDSSLGVNFAGVNFYDGGGFMVRESMNVSSARQLDGTTICIKVGATTVQAIEDFFRVNGMAYQPMMFEKTDDFIAAYDVGRCDVISNDRSFLAAIRLELSDSWAHVILPETISKEPLGPAVRHGDDAWLDIVKWSLFAMVEAEELGITSQNVDDLRAQAENPNIRRLLGVEGDTGQHLGLAKAWSYNIIKQVGNYSESFDRHVGENSPLRLSRGMNALWTNGGLLYAMPLR